jgi:cytochrome P450
MGPQTVLMVNDPALVKQVLQDKFTNYRRSRFYDVIRPILGEGIFLSEDERWLRQRRLLQPPFHGRDLIDMTSRIASAVSDLLERWRAPAARCEPVDMAQEMMRLTLDIVFRTLLTVRLPNVSDTVYEALKVVLHEAEQRVWSMLPMRDRLPIASNRAFRRGMAELDDVVRRVIADRRADRDAPRDLLTILLDAFPNCDRDPVEAKELRDHVISIIIAGHETAANVLIWMWTLLSRSPEIERRMRQEVAAVAGDRAPTIDDVRKLSYTANVFSEAARLYPPVWTFSREAVEDDWLGDVPVRKGSTIMVCAYAMHRNPRHWENPEGFDPDRFLPERAEARHPFAYFPFSAGPRTCLGKRFGQIEGVIVAAMVAQRYRLELVPGHEIAAEPMITLRPRSKVPMWVRPVQSGAQEG